jgi:PmbA protein
VTLVSERQGLAGERALRDATETALRAARGDEAEALVLARNLALTRFANNEIHQNMVIASADLRIRVALGTRVASVWTNRLDPEGLSAAAREASELAAISPENPQWPGLPSAKAAPPADAFADATADASPEQRARAAGLICGPAHAEGLRAAGFVSTTASEVAVANSHGVWAYQPGTMAEVQAVVLGDSGSAYADRLHRDVRSVDAQAVADEVMAKARLAQRPRDIAAGTYEVVLEPYAVADVIEFLTEQMSGLAVEEGRSFVGEKIGQKVTGDAITVVEDPLDGEGFPRGFDFEGVPTERMTLVERGVARAVVYDSQTAARNKARNTGHALYFADTYPLPMHIRLEPGTASREKLIAGVRRGLLVTRFWYTRWVLPVQTIVTGMTRDGVFAIEDGQIAHPVKNLRFTQSYHEALGSVVAMERGLKLQRIDKFSYSFEAGHLRVPAVHLGSFTFTGTTQY